MVVRPDQLQLGGASGIVGVLGHGSNGFDQAPAVIEDVDQVSDALLPPLPARVEPLALEERPRVHEPVQAGCPGSTPERA